MSWVSVFRQKATKYCHVLLLTIIKEIQTNLFTKFTAYGCREYRTNDTCMYPLNVTCTYPLSIMKSLQTGPEQHRLWTHNHTKLAISVDTHNFQPLYTINKNKVSLSLKSTMIRKTPSLSARLVQCSFSTTMTSHLRDHYLQVTKLVSDGIR